MPSTSPSEPFVKVKELSLAFTVELQRPLTWRDLFIRAMRHPLAGFKAKKEQRLVFDKISFTMQRGDRLGLLGVNGMGKTSLCRCIAGIYSPTHGHVQLPPDVRAIFDTAVGIVPELTGRENAKLLAEFLYPESAEERARLVKDALEFSELGDYADVPFKIYSNGMQARLCLSLISARACDLLILDEVFDGADQFFRKKIGARVKDVIEKSGAVIFVSHSSDQIREVCNRVLVLHQGKILFDGSPDEGIRVYNELENPSGSHFLLP